jgi:4-hydroxy-tetrahydrodipicolinate synthase
LRITGSIVALVTPWTAQAGIDHAALHRLIDWHVEQGSDALVIAGSTGESVSLDAGELAELWRSSVAHATGRIRLIAGTGTPSTRSSVQLTDLARQTGMDAALVVTPAYVRPTQSGLLAHYGAVAEVGLPVLLYNVPGRTAVDLLPATVVQLAALPTVVGIKEAVADPARITALVALRSAQFVVLSGDDPSALSALHAGFDGVISVAANAAPRAFASMVHAALDGDWARATALDTQLGGLYDALALEPNPIPVKYALSRLGYCLDVLRLPLLPLSANYHAAVDTALAQIRLVDL